MDRRTAIAILLGSALMTPVSAWAQGKGNGNGNGNGGGNGNGNGNGGGNGNGNEKGGGNGNGNGGGNGNGNGNGGGNGNDGGNGASESNAGGNGNGNANGLDKDNVTTGNGQAVSPRNPAPAPDNSELSETEALDAVQTGSAVPLETLLPDVRTRTGGEIINAELQEAQGFLLYAVTVLTPNGKVVTEYYYARSGKHVGN